MLRLVDLSNNNAGPIDFGAMKRSGIFGVWLKVTEGPGFVDATFHDRARAARAAGLHAGGYHFARPMRSGVVAQAHYFVSHLGNVQRRDLRPVLDLETNDDGLTPTELHAWARQFLAHVHVATKVRGLTYSGPAFILGQGWPHTFGTGAGLWLAEYGPNDGNEHPPHVPRPWRKIVAHQYTSVGRVAGVVGHVDLSRGYSRRGLLAHPVRGLL